MPSYGMQRRAIILEQSARNPQPGILEGSLKGSSEGSLALRVPLRVPLAGWPRHGMDTLTRRILTRHDMELIDTIDIDTP